MKTETSHPTRKVPWNKGKLIGQKPPLKLQEVWEIRIRLRLEQRIRDLALFDLAIDSKLRACDLVQLKVRDIAHGARVANRAMVCNKKQTDRFSLKSPNKPGMRLALGLVKPN